MSTITRSDIYARVHRGLRKAMFDMAYEAGRTDYGDAQAWNQLKTRIGEVIHFLLRHGEVEDRFQLPMIKERVPEAVAHDAEEHEEVHRRIDEIQKETARIDALESIDDRREAGEAFYLLINRFIGDYLAHMDHEETVTAPLYFEHCVNEELQGMMASIIASNAPADTMLMLRYSIPAIDPVERASFLGAIRRNAPPQAFEAIMTMMRGLLSDGEWERLQADLN